MTHVSEFTLKLTVSPGDSGTYDLTLVPKGRKLTLKRTQVYFPVGTEGELEIKILYGNMTIIPDSGVLTGDDMTYTSLKEFEFDSGSPVRIWYRNTNATYSKTCYLSFTFEVV
ncbi:MAG: hypothetical protein ACXQS5_06805 [Candidatus Methanospirareceae archaeon]